MYGMVLVICSRNLGKHENVIQCFVLQGQHFVFQGKNLALQVSALGFLLIETEQLQNTAREDNTQEQKALKLNPVQQR